MKRTDNRKTFIWDLDGTLVDSYPIILKNLMTTFSQYGEYDSNEIYEYIMMYTTKEFFEREEQRLGVPEKELRDEYSKVKDSALAEEYSLIEGAKETILRLNAIGHENIIYTHRDSFTSDILKHHGLLEEFKDIVTSDDGFKRKPDPDALLYLINKYDLDVDTCYYVGDREIDVVSGNAAGMKSIYFNPGGLEVEVADINVSKLIKIIEI